MNKKQIYKKLIESDNHIIELEKSKGRYKRKVESLEMELHETRAGIYERYDKVILEKGNEIILYVRGERIPNAVSIDYRKDCYVPHTSQLKVEVR